jgi:Spy/CpxP family protein refolding chaperone
MFWNRCENWIRLSALLSGIIFLSALSGNAAAQVAPRPLPPSATPGTARPPKQEPCWQIAGVSRAALQERRSITQQARQQVEGVCANSSLSAQQKRQEIQQIHQKEKQQLEGLITPAQQEAMRSCQAGRGHGGGGGGHMGGGGHGPCGEMATGPHNAPPPHSPAADEEDEVPASDGAKPN